MKSVDIMKCTLVRESNISYETVTRPKDAEAIFRSMKLQDSAEEVFAILCLTIKGNVAGAHIVSHGAIDSTIVTPREVFKRALLNNAAAIVCGHNHPSDDPTPSIQDIETTKRLVEAGALLGIQVADHIIITDSKSCSMRETTDIFCQQVI